MPYTFDGTDRRILEVIQEDARISNTELADRIGLPRHRAGDVYVLSRILV